MDYSLNQYERKYDKDYCDSRSGFPSRNVFKSNLTKHLNTGLYDALSDPRYSHLHRHWGGLGNDALRLCSDEEAAASSSFEDKEAMMKQLRYVLGKDYVQDKIYDFLTTTTKPQLYIDFSFSPDAPPVTGIIPENGKFKGRETNYGTLVIFRQPGSPLHFRAKSCYGNLKSRKATVNDISLDAAKIANSACQLGRGPKEFWCYVYAQASPNVNARSGYNKKLNITTVTPNTFSYQTDVELRIKGQSAVISVTGPDSTTQYNAANKNDMAAFEKRFPGMAKDLSGITYVMQHNPGMFMDAPLLGREQPAFRESR